MVFDDIERTLLGPARPTDTHFRYLNLSARPAAALVRALVEGWMTNYPDAQRPGMVARLRSPIDPDHISAFFELTLHELFRRSGLTIVAVEPRLEHTDRTPDFLIQSAGGERFYVEAVTAIAKTPAEAAADARLSAAVAEIEQADTDDFFLDLQVEGRPTRPVTLRHLRRQLAAWIAQLPRTADVRDAKRFTYFEHGMTLIVGAFLRRTPRQNALRAIGAQSMGAYWGRPGDGIRESVEKKSSRYGDLGIPYVVAVNAMNDYQGEEDAVDALLGSPCLHIRTFADGRREEEPGRDGNGVWWGPRGPRKQRLSAVLSTERLYPWSVAQRRARLIRNPWSTRPLPDVPLGVDELNPIAGMMQRAVGAGLREIFDLHPDWPEDH